MFTTNPFAAPTLFLSPAVLQGYIVVMALAVVSATLFDLLHEQKIKFFLVAGIAGKTRLHDIAHFRRILRPAAQDFPCADVLPEAVNN